jgi:hypothetical protein
MVLASGAIYAPIDIAPGIPLDERAISGAQETLLHEGRRELLSQEREHDFQL